jgi:hypothetical protein
LSTSSFSKYRIWGDSIPPVPLGRRGRARYPITLAAEYIVDGCKHTGLTSNISSSGMFIATNASLPVAKQIKISIDWPAVLDGRCPLRLVVLGRVHRVNRDGMAIAIEKYEFRLRSRVPAR